MIAINLCIETELFETAFKFGVHYVTSAKRFVCGVIVFECAPY